MRVFISDIHLSHNKPELTSAFFWFLKDKLPTETRELYILGDLFEFWCGDDCADDYDLSIANALTQVAERNIKVFLCTGNKDFLIGKRWLKHFNGHKLPEHYSVNDLTLCHGDSLCTDDVAYQKYKKKRDSWWAKLIYFRLTKRTRLKLKEKVVAKSKLNNANSSYEILDVTPQGLQELKQTHPTSVLIHGHTHRIGCHPDEIYQRWVLGDWGKFVSYLIEKEGKISLHQISNPFNQ